MRFMIYRVVVGYAAELMAPTLAEVLLQSIRAIQFKPLDLSRQNLALSPGRRCLRYGPSRSHLTEGGLEAQLDAKACQRKAPCILPGLYLRRIATNLEVPAARMKAGAVTEQVINFRQGRQSWQATGRLAPNWSRPIGFGLCP